MTEITRQQIGQRKLIFNASVFIAFAILAYGFFNIQIAGRDKYHRIALENSVRQLTQYPVRGTLRDRTGRILVDNRPAFMVSVIPRQFSKATGEAVSEILAEPVASIREKIKERNSFRPVIIRHDVDFQTLIDLEEKRFDLPGVLVEVESKRYYPEKVFSPHIFGYIGEVSPKEALAGKDFEPGEMIGKSGLELVYDSNLRGVKGVYFVGVDAQGRDLGMINTDRNIEPVPGTDLYLTLDYTFQQFAESLMVDKQGAIVAIDPRNGKILAFVSKPDFDPRDLAGKISPEIWNQLQSDPTHPLFNRVTQSTYPPGSTYKLVAAIAALQENIITPEWSAYCPGYFRLGNKVIKCWNAKGHGRINLPQAIKGSCNVYFYQLGLKIGLDVWAKYSQMFLFGKITGIDLPNETRGLVPTEEYFNKRYGRIGWTKGNLANLAIGQGELLTTPLQMAQFAMILANKGIVYTPHLTDYLYDKVHNKRIYFPVKTGTIDGISDPVFEFIRTAMFNVVNGGTGGRGAVRGIQVAGKTGTAQNPHGDDHAWFIAFAPVENPTIAMAVLIENGGSGGANAAPIAGLCMEKFFYNQILPRFVAVKDTTQVDSLKTDIPIKRDSTDTESPAAAQDTL
jgi:penicillin-binding protein 2